jgi:DNA-binding NarL/FixJ family response regulator
VIRIAIADDQPLVRQGLHTILSGQPDFEVVGAAADGRAAVALVAEARPDVLLLDVRMPKLDGIGVMRELARRDSPTRVLVLTTFDLDEYVYETMRDGASGYLLKDAEPADLATAVRAVHRGDTLLGSSMTRRLVERYVQMPAPGERADPRFEELTEREREVLLLIARGHSNAEIARELFLSEATVKTHVTRILGKLDLRDRLQAVVLAYESGLVTPGASSRRD